MVRHKGEEALHSKLLKIFIMYKRKARVPGDQGAAS